MEKATQKGPSGLYGTTLYRKAVQEKRRVCNKSGKKLLLITATIAVGGGEVWRHLGIVVKGRDDKRPHHV